MFSGDISLLIRVMHVRNGFSVVTRMVCGSARAFRTLSGDALGYHLLALALCPCLSLLGTSLHAHWPRASSVLTQLPDMELLSTSLHQACSSYPHLSQPHCQMDRWSCRCPTWKPQLDPMCLSWSGEPESPILHHSKTAGMLVQTMRLHSALCSVLPT